MLCVSFLVACNLGTVYLDSVRSNDGPSNFYIDKNSVAVWSNSVKKLCWRYSLDVSIYYIHMCSTSFKHAWWMLWLGRYDAADVDSIVCVMRVYCFSTYILTQQRYLLFIASYRNACSVVCIRYIRLQYEVYQKASFDAFLNSAFSRFAGYTDHTAMWRKELYVPANYRSKVWLWCQISSALELGSWVKSLLDM